MVAIEEEEADVLLQVGMLTGENLNGLQGLVQAAEGLLLDDGHTAAFIYDDQVEYSFHSAWMCLGL